jgi:hypothetical protein
MWLSIYNRLIEALTISSCDRSSRIFCLSRSSKGSLFMSYISSRKLGLLRFIGFKNYLLSIIKICVVKRDGKNVYSSSRNLKCLPGMGFRIVYLQEH